MSLKYNFGCGKRVYDDYVNVDIQSYGGLVDKQYDLSVVPYSFAEYNSADEILAKNLLEYIPYRKTAQVLKEWHDIIKDDGEIIIEVKDAGKAMKFFVNELICDCVEDGQADPSCFSCSGEGKVNKKNWLQVFTGEQKGTDKSVVKNIYTKDRLNFYLKQAGFSDYDIENIGYNLRVRLTK